MSNTPSGFTADGFNGGPLRAPLPRIHAPQMAALRAGAVAAGLPVTDVRTMDEIVSRSTSRQRFNMLLLTLFGAVAF